MSSTVVSTNPDSTSMTAPQDAAIRHDLPKSVRDLETVELSDIRLTPGNYAEVQDLGAGQQVVIERSGGLPLTGAELRAVWQKGVNIVKAGMDDVVWGSSFLVAEGCHSSNCLVMLDGSHTKGALVNIGSWTYPEAILNGYTLTRNGDFSRRVTHPSDVFKEREHINVLHIYSQGSAHSPEQIEAALRKFGFTNPVKHLELDRDCWHDIALDVATRTAYIVMADRQYPGVVNL